MPRSRGLIAYLAVGLLLYSFTLGEISSVQACCWLRHRILRCRRVSYCCPATTKVDPNNKVEYIVTAYDKFQQARVLDRVFANREEAEARVRFLRDNGNDACIQTVGGTGPEVANEYDCPKTPLPRAESADMRLWKNSDESRVVLARFVRLEKNIAFFESVDGKLKSAAIDRLSRADQEWIARLQATVTTDDVAVNQLLSAK